MDIHKNARLTPHGRERLVKMVLSGQTPKAASQAAGVCPRTGRKWRDRFEQEGLAGLRDRSSRPHRLRKPTSAEGAYCKPASPAHARQGDRRHGRRLAGHRQPRAEPPRPQQAERPRACRAAGRPPAYGPIAEPKSASPAHTKMHRAGTSHDRVRGVVRPSVEVFLPCASGLTRRHRCAKPAQRSMCDARLL